MTSSSSNTVPVFTLHSLKGGVGKTTLALDTAVLCSRKCKDPKDVVCLIDLDFFGAPLLHAGSESVSGDILDVLLHYDRASPSTFSTPVQAHALEVSDLLGDKPPSGKCTIAYLGTTSEAARKFAPLAMGGWQCTYVAERLWALIRYVCKCGLSMERAKSSGSGSGTEYSPKFFVIDNPPGLHGISSAILKRMDTQKDSVVQCKDGKVTLDHRPLLVVTPQASDTRALELSQKASGASDHISYTVILNRAGDQHIGKFGLLVPHRESGSTKNIGDSGPDDLLPLPEHRSQKELAAQVEVPWQSSEKTDKGQETRIRLERAAPLNAEDVFGDKPFAFSEDLRIRIGSHWQADSKGGDAWYPAPEAYLPKDAMIPLQSALGLPSDGGASA